MTSLRLGLAHRIRRLQRAFGVVRPAVLMYHRVATSIADPWGLCVSPDNFEQHLRLLREHAEVVPLSVLAERHARGTSIRRMVAITFDDGYPDVLDVALPLMEKYQCPATVFLPTGYMADQRSFWWDTLSHVFLERPELPANLDLMLGGRRRCFSLDGPSTRRSAHDEIWSSLRLEAELPRREAIDIIEAWAGSPTPGWASAHRCIGADEAATAYRRGFLDLGAHTKSHPSLPSLGPDRQVDEIAGSVASLREITGGVVANFAYPYGDYDERAVQILRDIGVPFACTTRHGRIGRRASALELPRLYVPNLIASDFSREILAHD